MKMSTEHYSHIKQAILSLPSDKAAAHKEALKSDPRVKDLDMRFRWDLLYAAKLSGYICDNCYSYLNDTHIDTALKSIVRELEL